ncbi:MAG: hypothetical protein JWQ72_657, partial [Polaromonas sp.]|nr:hypothetical protein [Polaromonas sp.]
TFWPSANSDVAAQASRTARFAKVTASMSDTFDKRYAEDVAAAIYAAIRDASTKPGAKEADIKPQEVVDALVYVLAGLLATAVEDADTAVGRRELAQRVADSLIEYMAQTRELIEAGGDDSEPSGMLN